MKIWVDADACPKVIRETIVRAAERTGIECTFVANHVVPVPKRANIHSLQVPAGFDIADNEIVRRVEASDLVIFHLHSGCHCRHNPDRKQGHHDNNAVTILITTAKAYE